eukprot:COSAG02_NODE_1379_length_12986_cov_20.681928_8_plen_89_part_00
MQWPLTDTPHSTASRPHPGLMGATVPLARDDDGMRYDIYTRAPRAPPVHIIFTIMIDNHQLSQPGHIAKHSTHPKFSSGTSNCTQILV